MTFIGAIKSGFENFTNFSGRAVRSEYWFFVLFVFLFTLACKVLDRKLGTYPAGTDLVKNPFPEGYIYWLFLAIVIVPHFAVGVRRLHDTDRSGYWYGGMVLAWVFTPLLLLVAVPLGVAAMIAGFLFTLALIYWLASPGTPGDNRFGPPRPTGK